MAFLVHEKEGNKGRKGGQKQELSNKMTGKQRKQEKEKRTVSPAASLGFDLVLGMTAELSIRSCVLLKVRCLFLLAASQTFLLCAADAGFASVFITHIYIYSGVCSAISYLLPKPA